MVTTIITAIIAILIHILMSRHTQESDGCRCDAGLLYIELLSASLNPKPKTLDVSGCSDLGTTLHTREECCQCEL